MATIWCEQDPPRFYCEVIDHVIAQVMHSVVGIREKHVDSDVSVISQSGMILNLLLIQLLCITTINSQEWYIITTIIVLMQRAVIYKSISCIFLCFPYTTHFR